MKPFFFEARDCQAQEVALAIGSYYSVSVLVNGDLSARNVTGRLYAETLTEAVESLAFLLGARKEPLSSSSAGARRRRSSPTSPRMA